ncbi:MAG: DUF4143 domain-containing protein [bacterium]|nr:DUF4143 domain-containing protein [bacterium]
MYIFTLALTICIKNILFNYYNSGEKFDLYFWRDNHKKEIDLIVDSGINKYGIEIKKK